MKKGIAFSEIVSTMWYLHIIMWCHLLSVDLDGHSVEDILPHWRVNGVGGLHQIIYGTPKSPVSQALSETVCFGLEKYLEGELCTVDSNG